MYIIVEDKIIEKDIVHKLPTSKASVPRSLSVKWNFKAKPNLFARDKMVHYNDIMSINKENIKN